LNVCSKVELHYNLFLFGVKYNFRFVRYFEHNFTITNEADNFMSDEISSNALERGFAILEAVANSTHGLSNSDISRRLDIPKSSASYLLRTLEKLGYLQRDASSNKYHLGLKLLTLTRNVLVDLDVREVAKPFLERFAKQTLLPSHLAVMDNGRAVYVEKVEAPGFVKMDIWVGHRVPVHTTAIGKAIAAFLPETEVERILTERGMEKLTLQSISTHTRFARELEKVRQFGFAIDNEENADGVRCVAAPIFDYNGEVVAAFGTSSTTIRLTEARLPEIVDLIKKSAAEISKKMGFSG
jgi:DNA-binding IclR family transcriptional regulator